MTSPSSNMGQSRDKRTATLVASRKVAQEKNHRLIEATIKTLERARKPINVAAVAREAKIARRTVYRSPYIEEIQTFNKRTHAAARPYLKDMQSRSSADRRLEQAIDQMDRLKTKIKTLELQNRVLQQQLDTVILSARKR